MQPGEGVLTYGAFGVVGTVAIQIAKDPGDSCPATGSRWDPVMPTVSPEKLATIAKMAQSGELQAVIDRTYTLAESANAMRLLEKGHSHGTTIVSVAGSVVGSDVSSNR